MQNQPLGIRPFWISYRCVPHFSHEPQTDKVEQGIACREYLGIVRLFEQALLAFTALVHPSGHGDQHEPEWVEGSRRLQSPLSRASSREGLDSAFSTRSDV